MKRNFLMMAISTVFLIAISVVAYMLSFSNLGIGWTLGIASIALAVGIVVLLIFKRFNFAKCIVMAINAVSMGFYLRAWYINRGFNNSLWLMLFVVALAVLYYLIAVLPLLIPAISDHQSLYLVIFMILSIVGFICLVNFTKTTWVSTLGYFGLLQLGFVVGMYFGEETKLYSVMVASTYTVAICGAIIVLFVLGMNGCDMDCECCDCNSSGGNGGGRKAKTKAPKTYPTDSL